MWQAKSNRYFLLMVLLLLSCAKDDFTPQEDILVPEEQVVEIIASNLKFPKRELRGVWIATVWGLDWPRADYIADSQKEKYIVLLDKLVQLNINTLYFQVKGLGDAFYSSPYEPWSSALTGIRGKNPDYDVLKFMIDEAHIRGIEFHAWMNPYRIATRANNSTAYPSLHPAVDPSWVVSHEKIQIYNPAIPAVRQRLADIVKDLISKYEVDGIHFDDYFYPVNSAAGDMVSDESDYLIYGAEYATVGDFRRDNVNKTIKAVYDIILATKPAVVFSVSPAPNSTYNYNSLYADVIKWCQEGWVDVLIPQLYQEIGNQYNDFQKNLNFWVQNSHQSSLVIGHALYKFGDLSQPSAFGSSAELQRQFDLTRSHSKVVGNVMYSARYLLLNTVGVVDKLAQLYGRKAVVPFVGRTNLPPPVAPSNVRIENGYLKWDNPSHVKSIVYHFSHADYEGRILSITREKAFPVTAAGYYCVGSLNEDNQETRMSVAVKK